MESWDLCQQIFLIGDGIFAFIFALDVTVRLIVLRQGCQTMKSLKYIFLHIEFDNTH